MSRAEIPEGPDKAEREAGQKRLSAGLPSTLSTHCPLPATLGHHTEHPGPETCSDGTEVNALLRQPVCSLQALLPPPMGLWTPCAFKYRCIHSIQLSEPNSNNTNLLCKTWWETRQACLEKNIFIADKKKIFCQIHLIFPNKEYIQLMYFQCINKQCWRQQHSGWNRAPQPVLRFAFVTVSLLRPSAGVKSTRYQRHR